ncbi:hypothetical protein C0J52_08770 [Blattella germanica]|nr:hypothetical protein C0J52_08770 [Blattella germanica]
MDLEIYAETRKAYKSLLRNKRPDYMEKEARRTAEDAKKDPFVALKKRDTPNAGGIAMDRWENHFLESSDLKRLEKVKASYLKKVPGVARNTKSRLAYELTREMTFLEDIHLQAHTRKCWKREKRRGKRFTKTSIPPPLCRKGHGSKKTNFLSSY